MLTFTRSECEGQHLVRGTVKDDSEERRILAGNAVTRKVARISAYESFSGLCLGALSLASCGARGVRYWHYSTLRMYSPTLPVSSL